MIKLTFLGTNGWYDSNTGNTISILVETKDFYLIMDAGNGFAKLSQFSEDDKPFYLFLSHFHLDHIIGLHTLDKYEFKHGLKFMIEEGGSKILKSFLSFPFTAPLEKMPFKTEFIEVPENSNLLPMKAEFLPMLHTSHTLGIRVEIDGKVISYCPDTGYCKNAVTLAANADILITECAYRPGETNENWPHLNPDMAARIATEANAKKLILTHFDAEKYPSLNDRYAAEETARKIFKETRVSIDGMQIEI